LIHLRLARVTMPRRIWVGAARAIDAPSARENCVGRHILQERCKLLQKGGRERSTRVHKRHTRGKGAMILENIRASLSQFTPAERRVAEAILANPHATVTWSITDAARICNVSEPSITRFCRRLGFDGFPNFRLMFAQDIAILKNDAKSVVPTSDDPITSAIIENCERAISSINDLRMDIDSGAIHKAVDILTTARRIDVYGFGGSGFLASEAQHRMAFLGIPSVAYSDPTLQMVSAPALSDRDAVFALSFSGVTSYLIGNLELVRNAGARIVTMSPYGSTVAQMADVNIAINAYRSSEAFNFLPTERVSMYVMLDALLSLVSSHLRARV
jgi:RpiR family transcriptional regulator, carbohydrate utilization regulator